MRSLYIDCQMGVAGDMLLAALLELCDYPEEILETIRGMGIPNLETELKKTEREGQSGMQIHIVVEDDINAGRTLADVYDIIDSLTVSDQVKKDAKGVYQIIAEAEAVVHKSDLDHVHFHEVGSLSAVSDITGVCLVMENLTVDKVIASPIHVGSGTVKCAHGILPVPAPATAQIVADLPTYSSDVFGELCTPTGAALIKYFADEFGPFPEISAVKTGRGFGTKVFPGRINGIGTTLY